MLFSEIRNMHEALPFSMDDVFEYGEMFIAACYRIYKEMTYAVANVPLWLLS